jgi:putative aldouronate transport system permease protein
MALPAVVYLFIFAYLPMVGVMIAFQDYHNQRGIFGSSFIGLKNFQFLFSTTDAFVITRNTVAYNLVFILFNMCLALVLSMMLSMLRSQRTAKVIQTVYMLPYFLSYAVINIIAFAFLDRSFGMVNGIMSSLDLPSKTNWYHQINIWPPLLVFVNAWRGVGYQTVLYLAGISGISHELYEAAMLDGATKLKQAWSVTLPHLRFLIGISIILAMANIFRGDFGLFYVVTRNSGRLYPVTDVIDTYIYRSLTQMSNIGMSTAAGLYQSVVGLVMVIAANKIVTKIDPDSALF